MIRLQRIGKKKQPSYRVVVSDRIHDTQGRSVEIIGHYNSLDKKKPFEINTERVNYWLSVGAQPSATVHNLMVKAGMIKAEKKQVVGITKRRAAKLEKKKTEAAAK